MNDWLERNCIRVCRNRVIFWGILAAGALAIVAANARYAWNFVAGPFAASAQDLGQITDANAAHHYFVRVAGTKAVDTGLQEITTETRNGVEESHYVSANFSALLVGDRYLIVKSPGGGSLNVSGQLLNLDSSLRDELFSGVDAPSSDKFYPFYLDTTGFRTPGWWALAIGVVLGACLYGFARPAWKLWHNIEQHPVLARVAGWGDRPGVAAQVEQQMNAGIQHKAGNVRLTNDYAVTRGVFGFNLLRMNDLLWLYKRVTKHRTNGIPTGKTYQAVLIFYGGSVSLQTSEKKVDGILTWAAARSPWAVVGYSDDLKKIFSKQQKEFCAAVEERRHKLAAGPGVPAQA